MIIITKNLLNHYFLPLLKEVLTDMAEGKKNQYLSKLLIAEDLTPLERTNFMNDYFVTRPLHLQYLGNASEQERAMFRDEFLAQLKIRLKNRLMLSGLNGLTKAYLPHKDQQFNVEQQRNVYLLAYTMVLGFEKSHTKKIIEARSAQGTITQDQAQKDARLLENGDLKLLEINGEWQYLSGEQLKVIGSSPQYRALRVAPYINFPLYGTAESLPVVIHEGGIQEEVKFEASSSEMFVPLAEMEEFFDDAKLAQLEMILSERGLDVVGQLTLDQLSIVNGKVRDPEGKIYEIHIDTSKGIDPQDLKATYSLPKETGKEIEKVKEQETVSVDFSKLELKVKPQNNEKQESHEQEIKVPEKVSSQKAQPHEEILLKENVFVLPGKPHKIQTPPQKVLSTIPKKAKVPVWQQKMAREAKPVIGKKAAPATIRPPMKPTNTSFTPQPKAQRAPVSKKTKNPMVGFAKWGTIGGVASFVGASGVLVFSKFF